MCKSWKLGSPLADKFSEASRLLRSAEALCRSVTALLSPATSKQVTSISVQIESGGRKSSGSRSA
eukprot:3386563-Karenia_brevis.AAC.1